MTSSAIFPLLIRTTSGYHIYDPISNEFLNVREGFWHAALAALNLRGNVGVSPVLDGVQTRQIWDEIKLPDPYQADLDEYRSRGFLYAPNLRVLPHHSNLQYSKEGNSEASHLILELTDSCNMRCKYCTFSKAFTTRRRHGSKAMSRAVIRQAIDWYFERYSGQVQALSFYGGEPFLRFDDLLYAVDYARNRSEHTSRLYIGVTTNGTQLSLDRAAALFSRQVHVDVSLDGDEEVHDWARVDAIGNGTFRRIMLNLESLWATYGPNLREHLAITSTLDSDTRWIDIRGWIKLQERYPFLRSLRKRFHGMGLGEAETDYVHRPGQGNAQQREELAAAYVSGLRGQDEVNMDILGPAFGEVLTRIHNRSRERLKDIAYSGGMCAPGNERVMVSVDGNLLPCERVDSRFCIGTLREGIDAAKAEAVVAEWRDVVSAECQGCFAIRFCGTCASTLSNTANANARFLQACRGTQLITSTSMALYCELRERGLMDTNTFEQT